VERIFSLVCRSEETTANLLNLLVGRLATGIRRQRDDFNRDCIAIIADAPCPYPKKFWLHEEVIGHPRMLQ
jgi:hypothetical protein